MKRVNRLPFALVSGITFFVTAIWLFSRPMAVSSQSVSIGPAILIGIACALLYLASHLLRAIRLAVIGVYIYKTSFRTLAALNLSVAPWSLIAPFKLDELIRLNELRTVDGSIAKSLMVIVIDRSLDGPMFVAFAAILAINGYSNIALFAGFFGIAMIAVTIGFFAASTILHFAQSYIFLHYNKPRAIHTLKVVHQLRQLAKLGRETIRSTAPVLFVCTLGMWFFEISSVALMLSVFGPGESGLPDALAATLVRANYGWRALILGDQLGFPAALMSRLFFASLLVIWPVTIWIYCKRRLLEINNAEFLGRHWGQR